MGEGRAEPVPELGSQQSPVCSLDVALVYRRIPAWFGLGGIFKLMRVQPGQPSTGAGTNVQPLEHRPWGLMGPRAWGLQGFGIYGGQGLEEQGFGGPRQLGLMAKGLGLLKCPFPSSQPLYWGLSSLLHLSPGGCRASSCPCGHLTGTPLPPPAPTCTPHTRIYGGPPCSADSPPSVGVSFAFCTFRCHRQLCSAPSHGEKVTMGLGGASSPAGKAQGFWGEICLYWLSCAQLGHPKPHVPRRPPFPSIGLGPRGHTMLGASSRPSAHAAPLGGLRLPGNGWKPLGTLNRHRAPRSNGDRW